VPSCEADISTSRSWCDRRIGASANEILKRHSTAQQCTALQRDGKGLYGVEGDAVNALGVSGESRSSNASLAVEDHDVAIDATRSHLQSSRA
jgi:hypothetical protein